MTRLLWSLLTVFTLATTAQAGARDYFSEFAKDFGTTPRGPVLQHYFWIKNTTDQNVTLGNPRVSCGCVSTQVLKSTIAPGESTAVLAMMDTRRIQYANVTKTVTVYVPFLTPRLEEISLTVTTVTRDDLVMSPYGISLGTVRKGQPATASTKVTFFNDANWKISDVSSNGLYVKGEVKPAGQNGNSVTYEVTATLDPACPAGIWSAELTLTTSNGAVAKLPIPVTVTVTTPIAPTPEQLKVGELKIGNSVEHSLTLRGNQAFKVIDVSGGDDQVSVKADNQESSAVHTLKITVTPKAAGAISRVFEIKTDHKEMAKLSVPFEAKVVKP
jgi:hypothetical protein